MKPKKIAENVTLFSNDPIIYVVSDFLSSQECASFIEVGEGKMERATVITDQDKEFHANRTNTHTWVAHDANEIVHEASKRFSILVKMPINNAEQYQLVFYGPGNEYKPHFDAFDKNTPEGKNYWFPGGQRMITVLAYLNDVEQGGATNFPEVGVSIKPTTGDVLVFHNCLDGTSDINPKSIHAGSPVISGEKWAVNLWFRQEAIY